MSSASVFGGLEGGATFSKFVLVSENGEILSWVHGPGTNHYLLGQEGCLNIINILAKEAKQKAGIDTTMQLVGLGLCMSGCEEEDSNRVLEKEILNQFPSLTSSCAVASDTVGSILTASYEGGLVLIAGTGSNSLLINPDGSTARCGGWGHILGDEGSGFWISQKAVKAVFDKEDNFCALPYETDTVKQVILDHFKVTDKFGILEHCYVGFNKSFFAGLCEKLAKLAEEDKNELCVYLFFEAGKALASHVNAILPSIHRSLLEHEGGLPIICVGSVFKSWILLMEGFLSVIDPRISEFTLLRLNKSTALGAAVMGAKKANRKLPLNLKDNCSVLYHFK